MSGMTRFCDFIPHCAPLSFSLGRRCPGGADEGDSLDELNEYFRADDDSVRLDMVQTLRDIARMLDGEFGEGMEPNGWARDPDEYHKLLKQAKKQAKAGKRKLYVGT